MILCVLEGGLGNQLFQYAFARRLAWERRTELILDLSEFNRVVDGRTPRTYRLHHFHLQERLANPEDIAFFTDTALASRLKRRVMRAILPDLAPSVVNEQHIFQYDATVMNRRGHLMLRGYWQHPAYFAPIADQIRQAFVIKTPPSPENRQLLTQIQSVNAVSLHIRRGDYVTNAHASQFHGLIGLAYYEEAIRQIMTHVDNPHFFVFSDDPNWAKANLNIDAPTHIVELNNAETDYEDLRLMGACQHHIIANSSFSWWGAWLGQNSHKRVFAPRHWTNYHDASGIVPAGWTCL